MFGNNIVHTHTCAVTDPAADGTVAIWRVPTSTGGSATIRRASIIFADGLAAGTANGREVWLATAGTTGATAVTALTPKLGTGAGGTFSAWTANTEQVFTLGTATVASGQYVALVYDETGTDAWKNATVHIEYAPGA